MNIILCLLDMLPMPVQIFVIVSSALACGFITGVMPFIIMGGVLDPETWRRISKTFNP